MVYGNGVETCALPIGLFFFFFFFKQKTAYEMCGRDWSSDVCSSDLASPDIQSHRIYFPKYSIAQYVLEC